MRYFRRLMKWTAALGVLAGVAAGAFVLVRQLPRSTIQGKLSPRHLSADGSRLVTLTTQPIQSKGPLQSWDTRTGEALFRLFEGKPVADLEFSPDARHGAIVLGDESLWSFDWKTGDAWQVDGVKPQLSPYPGMEHLRIAPAGCLQFSPNGGWLCVHDRSFHGTIIVSMRRPTIVRKFERKSFEVFDTNDRYAFMVEHWSWGPIVVELETGKYVHQNRPGGQFRLGSPNGKMLAFEGSRWNQSDKAPRIPTTEFLDANLALPAPTPPPEPPGVTVEERQRQAMRAFWRSPYFEARFTIEHPICDKIVGKEDFQRQRRFSPDSRYFAAWLKDYPHADPVEIFELEQGKRVLSVPAKHVRDAGFSADGELFWFVHGTDDVLSVIEVATAIELWQRKGMGVVYHCRATGAIVQERFFDGIHEILDIRTGVVRGTRPVHFKVLENRTQFTPDGRRFAIAGTKKREGIPNALVTWLEPWLPQVFGEPSGFIVMDTATGRDVHRVLDFDPVALLSNDGGTLATVRERNGVTIIRVWDVDATRAWQWALAAFLVAAFGIWVARRGWRRLRQNSTGVAATGITRVPIPASTPRPLLQPHCSRP